MPPFDDLTITAYSFPADGHSITRSSADDSGFALDEQLVRPGYVHRRSIDGNCQILAVHRGTACMLDFGVRFVDLGERPLSVRRRCLLSTRHRTGEDEHPDTGDDEDDENDADNSE